MADRIPSGTRDVLPDEMRELRAMTDRIRDVFERAGYGEVYTPALEYETTLAGGWTGMTAPAYRVFDEHGHVLVLRTDMTIPIARLVDPVPAGRRAASVLLLRTRVQGGEAPARPVTGALAGRRRVDRIARARRHRRGADRDVRGARC